MPLQPTPGQIRYLQMLASGLSQTQIVFVSGRTRSTIYRQLSEARRRLGAETLEQAISIATSLGLIKPRLFKRKCPECQIPIIDANARICTNCGSMLPTFHRKGERRRPKIQTRIPRISRRGAK